MLDHLNDFATMMYEISMLYRIDLTEGQCALYWRDLGSYSPEILKEVWREHRCDPRRGCFVPKPADLIHRIRQKQLQCAKAAWDQVVLGVYREGPYCQKRALKDPIAEKILAEMGGKWILVRASYEQFHRLEGTFMRKYQMFVDCSKWGNTIEMK